MPLALGNAPRRGWTGSLCEKVFHDSTRCITHGIPTTGAVCSMKTGMYRVVRGRSWKSRQKAMKGIRRGLHDYKGDQPLDDDLEQSHEEQEQEEERLRTNARATTAENTTLPLSIGVLACLGATETGYLAFESLTGRGDSIACPLASSCQAVLGSSYAYLWDTVPLSLLGCVTYGFIAWTMFLRVNDKGHRHEALLEKSLLWSTTLLVSSSAYLGYLLTTEFSDTPCPWCMGSIALSLGIGALVIKNTRAKELEEHVMPGAGLMFSTVLILSLGLGNASDASGGITALEYKDPVVTTHSSDRAVELARRLSADGAKMYGAFWCSHCYEQKQDFGAEAMKEFPYVECFPEGWSQGISMAKQCTNPLEPGGRKLQGFPTWVIGTEVLEGEQSFEVLEDALMKVERGSNAETPESVKR